MRIQGGDREIQLNTRENTILDMKSLTKSAGHTCIYREMELNIRDYTILDVKFYKLSSA